MRLQLRPIDRWPHPELTADRKRTPFGATYSATLELLDRELRHLGAEGAVLQLAIREEDIKLDGELRANARPEAHPGVVLAFESKHGPLKYATDVFTHWQANLRAVALGLEALRRLDRYGISGRGEQYTGWKQLGSGIAMTAGFETRGQAARWMVEQLEAGDIAYQEDDLDQGMHPGPFLEDAYRQLAKELHPDRGGDEDLFKRLNAAHDLLRG